jgi:F5/8 type C domain
LLFGRAMNITAILAAAAVAVVPLACGTPDEASSEQAITITTDYALGKPTSQSTTAFGGDPSRAVDGNTSGVWTNNSVTHTNFGHQPWWQVDLLQGRWIDRINVFGRTDPCCTGRLANYWVMVSNTPFTSNDLSTTLADPNVQKQYVLGGSQLPVQAFSFGMIGRYVRVQLSGDDYLSLAEVQVLDQPAEIPGPASIATRTTWTPTGVITPSTSFAMIEVGDSLRSYQRGSDGLLQESIDFGPAHDVPGSPPLMTDGISAATDPAQGGHTFVVAHHPDGNAVIGELDPGAGTWTWHELWGADAAPAVAVACGKVYVASRYAQRLYVYTRPLASASWTIATNYANVRTPPAIAAQPGGDVGVAWIGTDNWIRFARGSCAAGGAMSGAVSPGGTSYSSTRVGLGAYGKLFGLAVQGTDNLPYFAMQSLDASGNPTWHGFESVDRGVPMIESPTVAMFRGLFFIAGRDSQNQLRYWVRNPNFLTKLSGEIAWTGGNIVSGYGTGATPPAFATRGKRQLGDNYSYSENIESELYVATKGIGDQQIYALNFGRFATWDVLSGIFGIQFNTQFEANGVDPKLVPNFPEFLPGFMQMPSSYWWSWSHSTLCNGTVPTTILLSTNYQSGWTMHDCGTFTGGDGRTFQKPATLSAATQYPAWTLWEEFGHMVQNAVPGFKSQPGWSVNFTPLTPRRCSSRYDCGGGLCAEACGTQGCDSGAETYKGQLICQNPGFGFDRIRPMGYVDWYDVTQDEHSFLNLVEWYRWWGDELRQMRDQDLAEGNTMLRDKYAWVKAYYFGGVEFTGSHAAQSSGSRSAASYGMPLQ